MKIIIEIDAGLLEDARVACGSSTPEEALRKD